MSEPSPLDHVAFAESRVLQAHGPRVRAVARGMARVCQEVEDLLLGLLYDRAWPLSGFWLRRAARLVGVIPGDLDDGHLRRLVDARILANRSDGTRESGIAVIRALFPGLAVRQFDVYPAASLYQVGPLDSPGFPPAAFLAQAGQIARAGKPGGVAVAITLYPHNYFGFSDDPDALGFDTGILAESL